MNDREWNSVCWSPELSLLVAVASSGTPDTSRAMYSTNGTSWTSGTTPNINATWKSVSWSSELYAFVAVADSGTSRIMVSLDGKTWTSRPYGTNAWKSICWSAETSMFAAVSSASTSGTVLTSKPVLPASESVLIANPAYVSVDHRTGNVGIGTTPTSTLHVAGDTNITGRLLQYGTPITYTQVSSSYAYEATRPIFIDLGASAMYNKQWNSVCWSPEKQVFAAVGGGTSSNVAVSYNGIQWIRGQGVQNDSNTWQEICWSPEKNRFVAVASSGDTSRVMYSSDGVAWTKVQYNDTFYSVCWSKEVGKFVAVGLNNAWTSTDGVQWTFHTVPGNVQWNSVCWSRELYLFVAVGQNPTTSDDNTQLVMISFDGINWSRYSATVNYQWKSVCWSPELSLFVAVASTSTNNTKRVMISSDGKKWSQQTGTSATVSWNSVCWSPHLFTFLAVGNTTSGQNNIMMSADGSSWESTGGSTYYDMARYTTWQSVCWSYDMSMFVMVGSGNANGVQERVGISKPVLPAPKSTVITNPAYLTVDHMQGRVGIGTTTPTRTLSIGSGGAGFNAPVGAAPMFAPRALLYYKHNNTTASTTGSFNVQSVSVTGGTSNDDRWRLGITFTVPPPSTAKIIANVTYSLGGEKFTTNIVTSGGILTVEIIPEEAWNATAFPDTHVVVYW